jgi:uncharacterized protein (DUF885 family)
MNAEFAALAEQVTERQWKHKPVAATYQGIHRYDDRFAVFNPEYLTAFAEESEDFERKLRRFKDEDLSREEIVERDLLRGMLDASTADIRDVERHTRSADVYIAEIVNGLSILVAREFAPVEERARLALERLRGVWRVLREGMANLRRGRNVPKVWTENGIHATEGSLRFLDEGLEDFIGSVKEKSLVDDLREAAATARCAIQHYLNFLRLDMLASSKGRFAVGKEHYLLLLKKREGLTGATTADLLELARGEVAKAQAKLEEFAAQRGGGKSWREMIDDAKKRVPDPASLVEACQAASSRARKAMVASGEFESPDDEKVEAPRFARAPLHLHHVVPSSICVESAPFEDAPASLFYVTPMEMTRVEEDRPPQSTVHCEAALAARAATEVYPGRHLRSLWARLSTSRVARFHGALLGPLGWLNYARNVLLDSKAADELFATTEERLFALRENLFDAWRAVIDIKMHCEEMTLDEAALELSEALGFDPLVAERAARRHTIWPIEGLAGCVGGNMLRELRAAAEAKKGFNPRAFHAEVALRSSLPFPMVRDTILAGETAPRRKASAASASTKLASAAPASAAAKNGAAAQVVAAKAAAKSEPAPPAKSVHSADKAEEKASANGKAAANGKAVSNGKSTPPAAKAVEAKVVPPTKASPVAAKVAAAKPGKTGSNGSSAKVAAPAAKKPAASAPAATKKAPPAKTAKSKVAAPAKKVAAKVVAKTAAKKVVAKKVAAKVVKAAAKPVAKTAAKAGAKASGKAAKPVAKTGAKAAAKPRR